MASYGLSVCPVLRIFGFYVGCAYSGLFVTLVYTLNLGLILTQFKMKNRQFSVWIFPLSYVVATVAALFILQNFLNLSHAGSPSRAPQILFLASLLLGITQFYGLNWAMRTTGLRRNQSINYLWRTHSLRLMTPIFAMMALLIHFAISQKSFASEEQMSKLNMANDVVLVVIFLSFWLSVTYFFHFMAEKDSVIEISRQLKSIEDGSFHEAPLVRSFGLWFFLNQKIESFGQTMKERNYLVRSFSRFVAQDIVQKATQNELENVEGESVDLTIIMTDLRGFTQISDNITPDKVILMLNIYFNMVINIFVKKGIYIDKFIGDGILAYVDPKKDALSENNKAIEAVYEILAELPNLNAHLIAEGLPPVHIGCGIHRGTVIRGLIGSSQRLEHTIIGDPVNRTARLESLTKEFGLNLVVSSEVYQNCSKELQSKLKELGAIKLKGIDKDVFVFGA